MAQLFSLGHFAHMPTIQSTQLQTSPILYRVLAVASVVHASFFGFGSWFLPLMFYPKVWFSILLTWPIWAFFLWRISGGVKRRLLLPLVFGFVALLPGFYVWYIFTYDFHPG